MKKIFVLPIIFLFLSLSLVSAFTYYYPLNSNYGNSNEESGYTKTTLYEEKESSTKYTPWGKETVTHQIKEETKIQRDYTPTNYFNRGGNYYKNPEGNNYVYSYPSYSNLRYHSRNNYNGGAINTYTTPYYYQPRYDDSGYYNWRY